MHHRQPNFLPTQWGLVARAGDQSKGDQSSKRSREALNELCQLYYYPIYLTIRRKYKSNPQDAEDLTQRFFADLIEKAAIAKADPARGKFRTFILACLNNFFLKTIEQEHAQKRDVRKLVAFDALEAAERYQAEPVDDLAPDRLFERSLALELLRLAEAELEADRRYDGKGQLFAELRPMLYEMNANDGTMSEIAARLSMPRATLKSHVTRMRARFREILRARAAEIVTHPEDAKEELLALQNAL